MTHKLDAASAADSVSRPIDSSAHSSTLPELLLVEGKAALDALNQVRDRERQVIFGLQGKLPNAARHSRHRVLSHAQTQQLLAALNIRPDPDCNPARLAYRSVHVVAEPDPDGQHILWLVLQLFQRYLQPLVNAGLIGVIQSPLARIETADQTRYVWNDAEKRHYLNCERDADNDTMTVFKGIASLSADERHYWLIDPDTRNEHILQRPQNTAQEIERQQ